MSRLTDSDSKVAKISREQFRERALEFLKTETPQS